MMGRFHLARRTAANIAAIAEAETHPGKHDWTFTSSRFYPSKRLETRMAYSFSLKLHDTGVNRGGVVVQLVQVVQHVLWLGRGYAWAAPSHYCRPK